MKKNVEYQASIIYILYIGYIEQTTAKALFSSDGRILCRSVCCQLAASSSKNTIPYKIHYGLLFINHFALSIVYVRVMLS